MNQQNTSLRRALAAGVILFSATSAWAFQSSATSTSGTTTTRGGKLEAPEINPALLVGAAVLVVGGILIVMSRRRRAAKA